MRLPAKLTRRRFVATGFAIATTAELQRTAQALGFPPEAAVCQLAAEQEVGPYYIAEELLRSNIAENKPGISLALRLTVLNVRTCQPISAAAVDIWHCDALGLYSGYTAVNPTGGGAGGPGGPGGPDGPGGLPGGFDPQHPDNHPGPPEGGGPPPENYPSDQLTFLRGIQLTDAHGAVRFETIFPGFYMGRTNHIHFKVRIDGRRGTGNGHATYLAGTPPTAARSSSRRRWPPD